MKIYEAEELAKVLIIKHLPNNDWQFQFDNARIRLGFCRYSKKTISLSKHYTPLLSLDEITDTILHEIAHALCGKKNGHNKIWKQKAIEIGCNGERLYHGDVKIKTKYVGICPNCGKEIFRHKRKNISCGKCGNGRFNKKYLFIWKLNN